MIVDWPQLKDFVDTRGLSIQYIQFNNSYHIAAFDGLFILEMDIPIAETPDVGSPQDVFETSYKASANKALTQRILPFASKTLPSGHRLFARNTGKQFSLSAGANTLTYTATFNWTKMTGIEVINCEALDYVDFKVYDNAQGTYSGVPDKLLSQFSFTHNLPKDYYSRVSKFDADVYLGMVLKFEYYSQSAKTIGINFILDEVV